MQVVRMPDTEALVKPEGTTERSNLYTTARNCLENLVRKSAPNFSYESCELKYPI